MWHIKFHDYRFGHSQVNINDIKIPVQTKTTPEITPQSEIDMAKIRQNKASAAKLKTTGNSLASGPQIQVVCRKQTSTT
jgi:hypothetical protein